MILVAYIAVTHGPKTHDYCARFVGSYLSFPPGLEHRLVVVCNGGPLPAETVSLFATIKAEFYPRVNDPGFDITAWQDVSLKLNSDLLICCGETIHFHKAYWLKEYVSAWQKYGPGMYGTFSSNLVRPHLNTTGFCISPKFMVAAPRPTNRKERYAFEHGETSIWRTVQKFGYPVKLVTWDGVYDPPHWRTPPNIMWRGDQCNCLMFCSHTDRWFAADEATRKRWSNGADFGGNRI